MFTLTDINFFDNILLPAVTDKTGTGTCGNRYFLCGPSVDALVQETMEVQFRNAGVQELKKFKL
jgi:hypothetical protein